MEQVLESLLSAEKPNERDSASYALKTIVREMLPQSTSLLTTKLVPVLIKELSNTVSRLFISSIYVKYYLFIYIYILIYYNIRHVVMKLKLKF